MKETASTSMYRPLGRSGLQVSQLCLGTMMFGGATDADAACRIISRAHDMGVNFIDTADVYNQGRSEEIVGRAIRSHRSDWIVATKVGHGPTTPPNRRGLSRRYVHEAVESSLRRLAVESIDVLYLHCEDWNTPLEETVMALGELIRQGKIRYFGVSNFRGWRIAEIYRLCSSAGIPPPVVSQPCYNAFNRNVEVEHIPACKHFGLAVVPYSPLARGVLSGKYDPNGMPPNDSRAGRNDPRMLESEWRPESLRLAQVLRRHAEAKGIDAVSFAIGWVLKNVAVSAVVVGPRTEAQWDSYVAALQTAFDPEDEAFVDTLVAPGHTSSPGFNDPAYPIEGR